MIETEFTFSDRTAWVIQTSTNCQPTNIEFKQEMDIIELLIP